MGERHIVIVGAGFSGTALAIHLLRNAREPLCIHLIDREQIARGVAYARRSFPYLLNVPAGRMSATAADADEFLRFAQRRLPQASAADFLPRELYGDYLAVTLTEAERSAADMVRLERLFGSAIALEQPVRSDTRRVHLADGRVVEAHEVVLALGNPPPAQLPLLAALEGSTRYVADPWAAPPQLRSGETVLVLGSGLTMADVVVAGASGARGPVTFHALSRRGLLPPPQSAFVPAASAEGAAPLLRAAARSARELLVAARRLARDTETRGGDWREAIAVLRSQAPRLWQLLGQSERQRFLRHVRAYWDVHRHRLPEASWNQLHEMRRGGALTLHAGRLVQLERAGRRVRALYRPRGATTTTALLVDRVINCTGPDYDVRRSRERLLRSLLAQGIASADPLGVGLATDARGALRARDGRLAADVFYLGPMLRAAHWETTAVAELREYAAQLARHLIERPRAQPLRAVGARPAHAPAHAAS
jgi:uncharacterized NAD(P)/FAD-binding protein YdhS